MTTQTRSTNPFCGLCGSSNEVTPVTKKAAPIKPEQVEIPELDLTKVNRNAKPLKKRKVKFNPKDNMTIKQALKKFTLHTIQE